MIRKNSYNSSSPRKAHEAALAAVDQAAEEVAAALVVRAVVAQAAVVQAEVVAAGDPAVGVADQAAGPVAVDQAVEAAAGDLAVGVGARAVVPAEAVRAEAREFGLQQGVFLAERAARAQHRVTARLRAGRVCGFQLAVVRQLIPMQR